LSIREPKSPIERSLAMEEGRYGVSIERARELLNTPNASDEEVKRIMDDLAVFCEVVYNIWEREKKKKKENGNDPEHKEAA